MEGYDNSIVGITGHAVEIGLICTGWCGQQLENIWVVLKLDLLWLKVLGIEGASHLGPEQSVRWPASGDNANRVSSMQVGPHAVCNS